MTLKQFDEDVLRKSLNVIEPEVTISETSRIILTSEDEYEDEYLSRPLSVRFFYLSEFSFVWIYWHWCVVFCKILILS